MNTRRTFIKNGGLALFGIGIGGIPEFVKAAVASHKANPLYSKKKVLICIFQRGAMDGLMAVTPFTDSYLKAARPTLFMEPGTGKTAIDLDGKFGLHPSFKPFEQLFKDKQLAIVHGMGSPNTTRSHFDAQDYMESGTPFKKGTASGWLNRAVGLTGHDATPFTAVSITNSLPRSLYGDNAALAINNLNDFNINIKGNKLAANMAAKSFEELYDNTSNELLKETGKESFEAIKILEKTDTKNYKPSNDAVYPSGKLGDALQQIAQLIKMDVGLEVAFAESGGWDTHLNQGTDNGIFARNATDLSTSIAALWKDLGVLQDDVTIMTMTEFGRTVKQNGTGGTDHGRASCSFILGNNVVGGKVHHSMLSLAKENLEDGRDLPVTTDFRAIFNEVANKHLKVTDTKILFPDWESKTIGVLK
jgi:uncharacterized protein (DUF1501 family)